MKMIAMLLLWALPALVFGQFPNGGFESMNGENPLGWYEVKGNMQMKISQDAAEGKQAVLLWTSNGQAARLENHQNYPYSGRSNPAGHPLTYLPQSLEGTYYMASSANCGKASVVVLIFRYTGSDDIQTLASGYQELGTTSDYTRFSVPISAKGKITDDARILVSITTAEGCSSGQCCYFYADDLRLGGGKPPHQINNRNDADGRDRK